ncbi:MAG TPA: hypothetical protein VHL11_17820, partial [Phototrophicaceae bacterium]|nr:hypothetical protein [Phototrophicaceae bacterium]
RCVGEPVAPPDGWAFDGTIIATGWAGIHGIRSEWATPHVLAFRDGWITEGGHGSLSPDGHWYAIPQATSRAIWGDLLHAYADVSYLLIYDLTGKEHVRKIEWKDSYELNFGTGTSRDLTSQTPVWFNQDTLIYQRGETYYFIYLPDLKKEIWAEPAQWQQPSVSPVWVFISRPSPDWSRIVAFGRLFNTETGKFNGNGYDSPISFDLPEVAWYPDSTKFILSGFLSTGIYDPDGQLTDTISRSSPRNGS